MGLGLKKKFKKVKKVVKKVGRSVGQVAQKAAPLVGMVPGYGTVAGAALGGLGSLASGDSLKTALKSGAKGAIGGYLGASVGGLPGLISKGQGLLGSGLGGLVGMSGIMSPTGIPDGGFQIGNSVYNAAGDLISDNISGGSGALGFLGNLLGGHGGAQQGAGQQGGFNLGGLGGLLGAGAAGYGLSELVDAIKDGKSAAEPVQKDVLSAEDKAFYNRPSQKWDMAKLQQDASASGMGLTDYVSRNMHNLQGGQYTPPTTAALQNQQPAVQMAHGGALSLLARGGAPSSASRHVIGPGSGREDKIQAELSDGEYVFDAESVAMLGDGSNKEGAKKLDGMRSELRKHKGKALSRGKFSPDAKSPLSYIKEQSK